MTPEQGQSNRGLRQDLYVHISDRLAIPSFQESHLNPDQSPGHRSKVFLAIISLERYLDILCVHTAFARAQGFALYRVGWSKSCTAVATRCFYVSQQAC